MAKPAKAVVWPPSDAELPKAPLATICRSLTGGTPLRAAKLTAKARSSAPPISPPMTIALIGMRMDLVYFLLITQIVLFQKSGSEVLWRHENVWPALRRVVHEIPVRPHRVDVVLRQLSSPEMKDLSVPPPEDMHHWQLHVVGVPLALVIGLIGGFRPGDQRDLRPSPLPGPCVD